MKQPPLTRLQELAGIVKKYTINEVIDSIGASDIHILNNSNSSIEQKPFEGGGTISYLKLSLTQDLAEADIDNLMTELKLIKDKLAKINHPQG